MSEVDNLKTLIKEAKKEAEKKLEHFPKGSCMNPKERLFKRPLAEHHFSKWTLFKQRNVFENETDTLPSSEEYIYKRVCDHCGVPEYKTEEI